MAPAVGTDTMGICMPRTVGLWPPRLAELDVHVVEGDERLWGRGRHGQVFT